MFHKFDHYGNVNCVLTRVYASLSNKHKDIDSLATLSDGLSFKGYLIMCNLRHRLRTFLFCRKVMFRSQDFQVFEVLIIP